MKSYLIIFVIACLVSPYAYAENETVNERLIRVEESVKSIDRRLDDTNKRIDLLREDINKRFEQTDKIIDKRFESMDKRLDDNMSMMHTIFNTLIALIGLICALIAFIIYDRVRANRPVQEKVEQIEKAHESINKTIVDIKANIKQLWERFNQEPQQQNLSPA